MARHSNTDAAIAITGLACRMPGKGKDLKSFWESISNGECTQPKPNLTPKQGKVSKSVSNMLTN